MDSVKSDDASIVWHEESVDKGTNIRWKQERELFSGASAFQKVEILELTTLGRCLILDNEMQSAESDEFIYHESLIHPAMLCHPCPKTVFIGGGGEGATAREVLRFPSVEKVVMVDIDGVALETSKKYLVNHHKGAFEDKRLELHVADAKKFLEEYKETFDVIVFDLADPIAGGPAYLLYTQSYYKTALSKLSEGGVIVTQSGPAGLANCDQVFTPVFRTLSTVFPIVVPAMSYIPSYCDCYSYIIATKSGCDPRTFSVEKVDEMLRERLGEKGAAENRFYDGETHQRLFSLPRYVRSRLKACQTVITVDHPSYRFSQPC